jgi:3-oxoacyl-[acyl-carrier protein] reductase
VISASPFSLDGRKAVVTGGSRGIGAAIVEILARHGAATAFCHLGDYTRAEELTERLRRMGFDTGGVEADVSNESDAHRLGEWTRDRFGSVDILVNCAGIGGGAPFTELSVGDWDRMIAVHLRGAFLVSRVFFAGMVARRWGRIINIASQLAFKGGPMLAHYCAAKAGVVGFTKALAHEGAPHGVLVNAVAPGPVETELLNEMSREWRDAKRRDLPLGRMGQPNEIAPTVLMLASDAGSFYVGQTLSPNGGDVML